MTHRSFPLADQLTEEDTGTDRMLKEEKVLLRQSSVKRALRSASATASVYEDKPKIWTDRDRGHLVHCARLTASSVLDKASPFWNRLPELQKLEVEDGTELMKLLTKQFVGMTNLEYLSVVWTAMKTVPSCCLKLRLKTLILQHDNLRSLDGVEALVTLEVLDASSNAIGAFPKNVANLRSLRELNICGNRLKQLPESIGKLTNLQLLNCSSNRLVRLPDSLMNLDRLVDLDISGNRIDQLPENFGNLSKLLDFRASGNQLTCLPASFAHLKSLVSLLIGNNRLLFVPMFLGSLERLEILNLRNNRISTVECSLTSVKSLVLDSNRLGAICSGVCQCENLEVLSLEKNAITTIPEEIANLKKLRSLQLNGNPISDIPPGVLLLLDQRNVKIRMPDYVATRKNEEEEADSSDTETSPNSELSYFPDQSITAANGDDPVSSSEQQGQSLLDAGPGQSNYGKNLASANSDRDADVEPVQTPTSMEPSDSSQYQNTPHADPPAPGNSFDQVTAGQNGSGEAVKSVQLISEL